MIKSTVGIGTIIHNPEVPAWARNYLDKNNLDIFYDVKVTKRKQAFARVLKEMGKEEILEELEFNSKGQAVFKWPSNQAKTLFLLKCA
jgi:hypothetical protein